MDNYLYDKNFLLALDNFPTREVYGRITALTREEEPIQTIEGRATGGSINIDGASALRRTFSMTLVAEMADFTDYYWTVKTKMKLEIGLRNPFRNQPDTYHPEWSIYPDICWFNQGIYILTAFSSSLNTGSLTLNLSGKDKMAQLNGECGGTLTSSVDFGKTEYYDKTTNSTFYEFTPIKDIVYNAVHLYGGEMPHKIIINDLDIMGKQLMEYRGEDPLYLITNAETSEVVQAVLDGDTKCYICDSLGTQLLNEGEQIKVSDIPIYYLGEEYINTTSQLSRTPTTVTFGLNKNNEGNYYTYVVQKVTYGQAAGYEEVPLTYASKESKTDLIGNVGENLVTILDKVKTMLGDYEYFYDIDGNFIFQRQQTYTNVSWADIINNGDGVFISDIAYGTPTEYDFYNSKLFTAFSNNPKIENIKNDYSVWGTKKTITGSTVPIHMRYAIDVKPTQYTSIIVPAEDIENFLLDKYELPEGYFNTVDGTLTEDGEYVVTLANDFTYKMKPQLISTTYYPYTPEILNKQRAMQYASEDTPELIKLVRKHPYIDDTKSNISNSWNQLLQVRLQLAEDNGWDTHAATQYIRLFQLWDEYYGDYGENTAISEGAKLSDCLETLLVPSKNRLSQEELELIKTYYYRMWQEELVDFGYNANDSTIKYVDWREIIYQMAKDFYAYNELDSFNWKIVEANGTLYPKGITGYERYYIDLDGFWRDQYWGWDEDLEPTLLDVKVQEVRPANRYLVQDKDVRVRSKMVPILAKDIVAQLDEEAKVLYEKETYTKPEDVTVYATTTAILKSSAVSCSFTITPSTDENIELIAIELNDAVDRNDVQNMKAALYFDNISVNVPAAIKDLLSFGTKFQASVGHIYLKPVSNLPVGTYKITLTPKNGLTEFWTKVLTINLTVAHSVTLPTLPSGVSQLNYYIYEHNPSDGYSTFLPWWQYNVSMQIDLTEALHEIQDNSADDAAAARSHVYFPLEEAEDFSINDLSGYMIKWIEDGGHCHDLMFYFFATLRRNKILAGRTGQDKKYSIFAARQYEDLFVLWDEYQSAEAKALIKTKTEYEIELANNPSYSEKLDISNTVLREVQSQYRTTFFEEYLNLLVTTPDVITLIDGTSTTRPEKYVEVIYQIMAHVESDTSAIGTQDRNKVKQDAQQLLEEYRESGVQTDDFIRVSNLVILWIMWCDEEEGSQKKNASLEARELLLYGAYDENLMERSTFNKIYFDEFAVEYDGTSYFSVIDDNEDYSLAMLEYATSVYSYADARYQLFDDVTFTNLAKCRMTKVVKYGYNKEAAQQLENLYKMMDYYASLNTSGSYSSQYARRRGYILSYLKLDNKDKVNKTPASLASGDSSVGSWNWNNEYKAQMGVDFNSGLAVVDTWEKKSESSGDYSADMLRYIIVDGHTSDDEEWISLTKKRKNKVLILNYSYAAADQFEKLCEMYMDSAGSFSALEYRDIIYGILTGEYQSDNDVLTKRITR